MPIVLTGFSHSSHAQPRGFEQVFAFAIQLFPQALPFEQTLQQLDATLRSFGFKSSRMSAERMNCSRARSLSSAGSSVAKTASLDSVNSVWSELAIAELKPAARAGKICGLKPFDISEDGMTIVIRRQYSRVTHEFAPTKGKKIRFVPCNPSLLTEVRALITTRKIKGDEPVFMNEERKPIDHDNFKVRKFAKDVEAWKGRSIRFHDLRHTATTLMISKGIDIKTVKEICGHADIATTMGYVHLVAGAVEQVSRIFSIQPEDRSKADDDKRFQVVR